MALPPSGARRPHEPKLLSAKDAAAILGVKQTNLRVLGGWSAVEPYDVVGAATLWRESDVLAFKAARKADYRRRGLKAAATRAAGR